MNPNFYGLCKTCRRKFGKQNPEDEHCVPCQDIINDQAKCTPNRKCKYCEIKFYSPNKRVVCSHCKLVPYEKGRPPKDYTEQNLKEKKKHTPKFTYAQLSQMMEHKRVWDDKGWKHYLKGRKWDRI